MGGDVGMCTALTLYVTLNATRQNDDVAKRKPLRPTQLQNLVSMDRDALVRCMMTSDTITEE